MNTQNLETLAAYLENGNLLADFDMSAYCDPPHLYEETCGSYGCAAGHGPYAGIPKNFGETWHEYEARVFDLNSYEWAWCFSTRWAICDPTPLGAARRIRFLISHPDVVNQSSYSLSELSILCNQEFNHDPS